MIIREMKDQELIRKAKKGLGRLVMSPDGKLDIVLFNPAERKEFEDLKEEASGIENGQMNALLGMFSEKLEKVVVANDEKIARTLDAVSEQSKYLGSLLENRNSNNGGGSNGRSVIVKEPPLPKLGPGQKYDDWIKQAEGWLE